MIVGFHCFVLIVCHMKMLHMYVTGRENRIFVLFFWKGREAEKQKQGEESFFRKLLLDDSLEERERIDRGFP